MDTLWLINAWVWGVIFAGLGVAVLLGMIVELIDRVFDKSNKTNKQDADSTEFDWED